MIFFRLNLFLLCNIFCGLCFLGYVTFLPSVWGQEAPDQEAPDQEAPDQEAPDQEDANSFINYGYISISKNYKVSQDQRFIIYRIRNNATRSIKNIFAWIYEVEGEDDPAKAVYRLVNNPNQGGLTLDGGVHIPGALSKWRFPLTAAKRGETAEGKKFIFRVSHRGIYFSNLEPVPKKKENKN